MYFGLPAARAVCPDKILKLRVKKRLAGSWHGACSIVGKTHDSK
jgi:hypothetical protein